MLAKYWKKIGLIIVIIACVFNVMIKLINKSSFDTEMITSAQYIQDQGKMNNTQNNEVNKENKADKMTNKTNNEERESYSQNNEDDENN